eukprot:s428_g9.t1
MRRKLPVADGVAKVVVVGVAKVVAKVVVVVGVAKDAGSAMAVAKVVAKAVAQVVAKAVAKAVAQAFVVGVPLLAKVVGVAEAVLVLGVVFAWPDHKLQAGQAGRSVCGTGPLRRMI